MDLEFGMAVQVVNAVSNVCAASLAHIPIKSRIILKSVRASTPVFHLRYII
jgi:hypothetical protein